MKTIHKQVIYDNPKEVEEFLHYNPAIGTFVLNIIPLLKKHFGEDVIIRLWASTWEWAPKHMKAGIKSKHVMSSTGAAEKHKLLVALVTDIMEDEELRTPNLYIRDRFNFYIEQNPDIDTIREVGNA